MSAPSATGASMLDRAKAIAARSDDAWERVTARLRAWSSRQDRAECGPGPWASFVEPGRARSTGEHAIVLGSGLPIYL